MCAKWYDAFHFASLFIEFSAFIFEMAGLFGYKRAVFFDIIQGVFR